MFGSDIDQEQKPELFSDKSVAVKTLEQLKTVDKQNHTIAASPEEVFMTRLKGTPIQDEKAEKANTFGNLARSTPRPEQVQPDAAARTGSVNSQDGVREVAQSLTAMEVVEALGKANSLTEAAAVINGRLGRERNPQQLLNQLHDILVDKYRVEQRNGHWVVFDRDNPTQAIRVN